ncbi:hypothetical protein SCLCIDRAFT_1090475 [Scleroderma citrinum Foug A]|uniref:Uncharacterized protein n=1 Tax=Scleroderma citrinum Foug A TaxID=1036808 RepID=A0A0C3DR66_9AGAM|nr:hypothetical protein SCLCIDRAFT_1090475 [Scleroderma citrinum Foug A]
MARGVSNSWKEQCTEISVTFNASDRYGCFKGNTETTLESWHKRRFVRFRGLILRHTLLIQGPCYVRGL